MPWAFEDDFSTGLSNWVPARWRNEQYLSANDPAHVYQVGAAGPGTTVDTSFDGATSGVLPPNDVKVDSTGRLWLGAGSQNYGDTQVRCNQLFDFSSGTGVIQLDARLVPCPVGLWGWSEVIVSDKPYTAVSMRSDNAAGPVPQYGFMVRLNQSALGPIGDPAKYDATSGRCAPIVTMWDNFVETNTGGTQVTTTFFTMTTIVITFTHSNITITYGGVEVMDYDWTLPAGLTNGWLSLSAHNHATLKYADVASPEIPFESVLSYNAVFDNVKFDGVVHDKCITYRVPDSLVTHGTGMDIGWNCPTGALTIPGVPARVNSAKLLWHAWVDPGQADADDLFMRYSLNGGTLHDAPFFMPLVSRAGASLFSVDIDESELVTGNNTVALSVVGNTSGYFPFVGNIGLLVLGIEPPANLFKVGILSPKRMRMGTIPGLKAYQGNLLVWEPPVLPFWTGSPATITITALSSTWSTVAPQTWVGTDATVTVSASSGTWSVPQAAQIWTDTDFVSINSGGDYLNWFQHGGLEPPDAWITTTAGQITVGPYAGWGIAKRTTACTIDDQYVRMTVSSFTPNAVLCTNAASGEVSGMRVSGYQVEHYVDMCYAWYNDQFRGQTNYPGGAQSGSGTIEWRVEDEVGTLRFNDVLVATVSFVADAALTGKYQKIGGQGSIVITAAEGGDFGEGALPTPQTWTGSAATVAVTGNSSTWAIVAPQTWIRSTATITMTGNSGVWSNAAAFTDDFNRANTTAPSASGTGLGSAWDAPEFNINSNHCVRSTSSTYGGYCRYLEDLGPSHYAQVVVGGSYSSLYSVLNAQQSGTVGQHLYMCFIPAHNNTHLQIARNLNHGYLDIASAAHGFSMTVPRTIRLEVEPGEQRGYVDGVLIVSATNAEVPEGHFVGFNCNWISGEGWYDDFECGPL